MRSEAADASMLATVPLGRATSSSSDGSDDLRKNTPPEDGMTAAAAAVAGDEAEQTNDGSITAEAKGTPTHNDPDYGTPLDIDACSWPSRVLEDEIRRQRREIQSLREALAAERQRNET